MGTAKVAEYLKSKNIDIGVSEIAKYNGVVRRTVYNTFFRDVEAFDEMAKKAVDCKMSDEVVKHYAGDKDRGAKSVTWDQYKKEVVKYRAEYDSHEYVAMLLLGIAEEYHLFERARRSSSIDMQLEKFGAFLFNVAELNNILEEEFAEEVSTVSGGWITETMAGVAVVLKYCTVKENADKKKLIEYAVLIAGGMVAAYATMITAQDAMVVSLAKMEARHL